MENVLDIIYNYSKKHKLLDKEAILLISTLLIKKYNISNINDIYITKKFLENRIETLAYLKKRKITICLSNLNSFIKNDENFINNYPNNLCYYMERNLQILQIIIHEMEHSIQHMMFKSESNDIETRLLNLEFDYIVNMKEGYLDSFKNYKNYRKKIKTYNILYPLRFTERMAQINAYSKIIETITPIKNEIPELFSLEEKIKEASKFANYVSPDKYGLPGPTILFFNYLKKTDELDLIDHINLSYEERLKYGFNLTSEEYEFTLRKLKRNR